MLEVLKGDREATEIARAYSIHPVTVSRWKQEFLEKGAEELHIDHKTKLVVGWGVAERKNTALALGALSMTHSNLEGMGMSLEDCFIHHDQDTVYTEYRWLQAVLIRERETISFSENGAIGNTYMESFNGHFKGESGGLFFDARNIWELRRAIAVQIEYYNVQRRHSTLGYLAPWTYIKQEVTLPDPTLDLAQISA